MKKFVALNLFSMGLIGIVLAFGYHDPVGAAALALVTFGLTGSAYIAGQESAHG